ncbi:unnamed protein product, partial [Urochloa humidicola]
PTRISNLDSAADATADLDTGRHCRQFLRCRKTGPDVPLAKSTPGVPLPKSLLFLHRQQPARSFLRRRRPGRVIRGQQLPPLIRQGAAVSFSILERLQKNNRGTGCKRRDRLSLST